MKANPSHDLTTRLARSATTSYFCFAPDSRRIAVPQQTAGDGRRLDERIEGLSADIETLVQHDPACQRLMTVPGIGPIISSAMVAAIGRGEVFSKGRDFGAWLGLVPKQTSTGDRTVLGRIPKRGNRYLRVRSCRWPGLF